MLALFILLFSHIAFLYCTDGIYDDSFGAQGQLITFFANHGTAQIPRNMAVQSDGKLLVGGRNNQVGGPCGFVTRYNADGTLDTSFGDGGQAIICYPSGTFYASDMVIQPDGKIIIGIITPVAGNDVVVLARLLPNGLLDATFGTNGFAQAVSAAGGAGRMLIAIAIQTDGSIVIAGSTTTTGEALVGRFLSNGTLDTSFGTNGFTLISPIPYGGTIVNFFGIQIQNDGKIVAIGDMANVIGVQLQNDGVLLALIPDVFFIARFLTTGELDQTFANGGVAVTNAGTGGAGGVIQPDGKILAYGSQSTPPLIVVRYNPDGSLDSSFADAGIGIYPLAGNISNMNCMGLQPDGKIVVANSFSEDASANGLMFTAVRILPNGDIDTSFADDGYVNTFVLGRPNCQTFACEVDYNGDIYITGTVENTEVGLVRYTVDSVVYSPLSAALARRYYNQNVKQHFN